MRKGPGESRMWKLLRSILVKKKKKKSETTFIQTYEWR